MFFENNKTFSRLHFLIWGISFNFKFLQHQYSCKEVFIYFTTVFDRSCVPLITNSYYLNSMCHDVNFCLFIRILKSIIVSPVVDFRFLFRLLFRFLFRFPLFTLHGYTKYYREEYSSGLLPDEYSANLLTTVLPNSVFSYDVNPSI